MSAYLIAPKNIIEGGPARLSPARLEIPGLLCMTVKFLESAVGGPAIRRA